MHAAETTRVVDGLLLLVRVTDAGRAARDVADEGIAGADALGVESGAIPDLAAVVNSARQLFAQSGSPPRSLSDDGASKGKGCDGKLHDMYIYELGLMWRGRVEWQLSSLWRISVCVGVCMFVCTHSSIYPPRDDRRGSNPYVMS